MGTFFLWWHSKQNQSNYKKQLSVLTRWSGRILLEEIPSFMYLADNQYCSSKALQPARGASPLPLAGESDFAPLEKMQRKCAQGEANRTHSMITLVLSLRSEFCDHCNHQFVSVI